MIINLNLSGVVFDEVEHRYFLNNKELKGITSTLVDWLHKGTYDGVPDVVLEKAAEHGKFIHSCIELVDAVGATTPEAEAFTLMLNERGLRVLQHEYIVTDRKRFASPIDVVLADNDNNIYLADIKTTYEANEIKTATQLSIYAYLFGLQNPHLKVKGVVEIWLPKSGNYRFINLNVVEAKRVKMAINGYLRKESAEKFIPWFVPHLPAKYNGFMRKLYNAELRRKKMAAQCDQYKNDIKQACAVYGVKSIDNDLLRISYTGPTTSMRVDTQKLKEKYPEVYAECVMQANVADCIRITLK